MRSGSFAWFEKYNSYVFTPQIEPMQDNIQHRARIIPRLLRPRLGDGVCVCVCGRNYHLSQQATAGYGSLLVEMHGHLQPCRRARRRLVCCAATEYFGPNRSPCIATAEPLYRALCKLRMGMSGAGLPCLLPEVDG